MGRGRRRASRLPKPIRSASEILIGRERQRLPALRSTEMPYRGALPLVVDTSAWSRASHPSVRARWQELLAEVMGFHSAWLAPPGSIP